VNLHEVSQQAVQSEMPVSPQTPHGQASTTQGNGPHCPITWKHCLYLCEQGGVPPTSGSTVTRTAVLPVRQEAGDLFVIQKPFIEKQLAKITGDGER